MKKRMSMARRKMSHVIDEVYTALFLAGGKEVDLRIVKEEEGLRLLVRGDFAPDHRKKIEGLTELLCPQVRNPALVGAYWELAGRDQYTSDSELALVGQMLDGAEVTVGKDQVAGRWAPAAGPVPRRRR